MQDLTPEQRARNVERLLRMRKPDIRNLPDYQRVRKTGEPRPQAMPQSSSLEELKQKVFAEMAAKGV